MSQDSSQEKTEQATPRKLEKARERGQVPRSNDLPSALVMLFTVLYIWLAWSWIQDQLKEILYAIPQLYEMEFQQALQLGFNHIVLRMMYILVIPFAMIAAVAGILGNIVQFGFVFSIDPVIPRPDKISPSSGFKRIFSIKQVVTTLLSLLKTIVVGIILLVVLRTGMKEMLHAVEQCDVICQKAVIEYLVRQMVLFIIPVLLFIAVLDYLFQHAQFMKDQRMTKEEVKKEMKDIYGDPHVRSARQGMRREMAEQDIHERIKTSRLIIIDMGVAIALMYEEGVTPLPVFVALGKGSMAQKMVEIATQEDVPIVSDSELARELVELGKIDTYIPDETIDRVAKIMFKTSKKKK